ncbi:hypothetical protein BCON_0095g00410 [Botryotinia convoluta]|uniref:Nephrocystin 3-like N-terminal domain-containing protein n=1 Tax=Botryotinia convoluta TaxID=54673 RepID=A0A4Z1IEZ2_9HELO|nr:hypothetical protein BCON_0095g00410 [Botryotinia convoluta]
MLDPLSALSLAATIIQFVDFGSKVISTDTELHHSSEGALANNLELSTIISDLSSISNDLSARSTGQGKHSYNKDELALIGLASQCKELSDKLLHDLDGLNIKKADTNWASARQAIPKYVLRFSDKHSAMSIALMGLQRSQDRTESNIMGYLSGLRDDLSTLSQDNLLEKFKYEGMGRRISNVVEAHNGTFDWVYDPQTTGFLQWLRKGGDIYWINGNAGSGKSTLMKYLVGNNVVKAALLAWAGTKPLFMGNCFFCYAGNELEKYQQGLLQSLLYNILGNCLSVLPKLFPERWASPDHSGINMDGSWSRNELLDAFEKLTKKQLWPGRFVFFIDGVDEYMEDPAEIARLLKAFATSADVKVIVSSRPWTEIETFIDPIPGQLLPLHYFTRTDIQRYTYDLITYHPDFRITQIDKRYWNLIEQISNKSRGVFLWVVLAVREILKGLTHQDTIFELEARLEDIPPGLDEVFDRMLNTIEKRYRHQTSQIVQMCLVARGMWPVITFVFLDEEQNNPDYVLLAKLNPWCNHNYDSPLVSTISSFIHHIKKPDIRCNATVFALIEEVDRIATDRSASDNFIRLLMMGYQRRWEQGWILALCVQRRIPEYVRQKLRENSALVNNLNGCYLLHIALHLNTISVFDDSKDEDDWVTMVQVLLEAGADSNQPSTMSFDPMRDTTLYPLTQMEKDLINGTWAAFIQLWFGEQIQVGYHISSRIRTEIFRLLLDYGAELSVKIIVRQEENGVTKSYMYYSLSEHLENALPDSAECYNLLLEGMRANE